MTTDGTSCNTKCVADTLGFGSLADGEDGLSPELLQSVYRYARNEQNNRILFEKDPTFARAWLNLEAAPIRQIIATFVAMDDADTLKAARRIAQSNLEAAPWNDVLGIESPPIRCRVKIHGNKWGLRFESGDTRMRGQELLNEQLPAIPGAVAQGSPMPESQPETKGTTTATTLDAADVLRQGGLL